MCFTNCSTIGRAVRPWWGLMSLVMVFLSIGAASLPAADLLLVTDGADNKVYSVDPVSGAKTELLSGLNGPTGISANSAGNVFISIAGDQQVRKYTDPTLTSSSVLISLTTNDLSGNATNSLGQIAVGNSGNIVQKYSTTTGSAEGSAITISAFPPPERLFTSFDTADNLYVAYRGAPEGGVRKYDSSGSEISSFATNVGTQFDIGGVYATADSVYFTAYDKIKKTDLNGNLVNAFGTNGIVTVSGGIATYAPVIIGNTLFLITGATGIQTFDATTGALINANFTSGFNQAFFMTKVVVPEPSTYALAAIGAAVLGLLGRRRKRQA